MNGMKYLVYQLEGSPETERLYLFPADEVHHCALENPTS